MINENWMRSISQSYKNLTEQQMMMPARPMAGQKRFHHPFRTSTAGPIQDQGPALVEPPKPNPMFPGPGAMGEVPGPQGKPIAGTEQSVPMMGMGQPQQPQIQIAQMGTFKQPFGEVPGQLGQMPQMGQMGMGQAQQMGAPGQNIQQALSKTRPITKIESLENRDVPDEFRYSPRAQQQQQGMGGMPQGMGQAPMGQDPQTPTKKKANQKLSQKEIKAMFDKIKRRGLGKK